MSFITINPFEEKIHDWMSGCDETSLNMIKEAKLEDKAILQYSSYGRDYGNYHILINGNIHKYVLSEFFEMEEPDKSYYEKFEELDNGKFAIWLKKKFKVDEIYVIETPSI